MPVSRTYNGGSIVFFQGDRGDDVYVLQKGRVILTSTAIDTGEEIKQDVQKGEFFGAKSSIGHYPREETAQALGQTTLLVFKQAEFEQLVLNNTRLVMKMLRVFSKQLRDVHRQVREVLKTGAARAPSFELMNVAESFYRSGNIDHAIFAFTKYLEHYPSGSYTDRAKELMQMARKGQTYPMGYPPLSESFRDGGNDDYQFVEAGMKPASQTLDDPFALNSGASPAQSSAPSSDIARESAEDFFYKGMDAFSKEDYQTALAHYAKSSSFTSFQGKEDEEAAARALYEKARTEMKLKTLDAAQGTLSAYLKKHPTGEFMKDAIFQMGIIEESKGNVDRAKTLYHKAATMPPKDATSTQARNRLEKLSK